MKQNNQDLASSFKSKIFTKNDGLAAYSDDKGLHPVVILNETGDLSRVCPFLSLKESWDRRQGIPITTMSR